MGIGNSGIESGERVTTGALTSATAAPAMYARGNFNVSVWGTFSGSVVLERSFDGGTTFLPVAFSDGTVFTYSAPMSGTWSEPEGGVMYRVRCSVFTSGTINWRLSQ